MQRLIGGHCEIASWGLQGEAVVVEEEEVVVDGGLDELRFCVYVDTP